jgi:hypothetical protein
LKKLKTIKLLHKELTILIISSYDGRYYDKLLTFISSY